MSTSEKKSVSGSPVSVGCVGVFSGPSSSAGAFCLHLMYICKEPVLCWSDAFGLRSSRGGWKKSKKEPSLQPKGVWQGEEKAVWRRPSGKVGGRSRTAKPRAGGGSHPFCTFALEARLRQARFFLGGGWFWLKSLIGALWNRNVKGN